MSDLPPGWDRARSQYENDCNDSIPRVCRNCPEREGCYLDPVDCEDDARARAAEDRWEARRDAYD